MTEPSTATGKRRWNRLQRDPTIGAEIVAIEAEARADVDGLVARLREAARFPRNVLISGWVSPHDFAGEWVAVPREDFDRLRALLAGDKAEAPE